MNKNTNLKESKILPTWNVKKLVEAIAKTDRMIAEHKRDVSKLEDVSHSLIKRLQRVMKIDNH